MTNSEGWQDDKFEDMVSRSLIACYESKIIKQRKVPKEMRLTEEHVRIMRKFGPYIPSNSRVVLPASSTKIAFDVENDKLPYLGLIAHKSPVANSNDTKLYGGYLLTHLIRRIDRLPKFWERTGGGVLYEFSILNAEDGGISGECRYFSVAKDGEVFDCVWSNPSLGMSNYGRERMAIELLAHGLICLVLLADRRHCWTITAQENVARAHLGCMQEEVKSLLYARSLPMTATGRKRPILHLVEAHKRRMRNGTDVDVTTFLRGQQKVEFGGTVFTVNPPMALQPEVSLNSQLKYYGADAC